MALANAFANAADAMEYLDPSVIEITFADDAADQQEAVNIIVGYLYGRIDPVILNTWTMGPPPTVPLVIRSIAGRLVASLRLGSRAMSDDQEVDPYARLLYNQAIAMLNGILTGRLVIPELVDADVQIDDAGHLDERYYDSNIADPMFETGVEY